MATYNYNNGLQPAIAHLGVSNHGPVVDQVALLVVGVVHLGDQRVLGAAGQLVSATLSWSSTPLMTRTTLSAIWATTSPPWATADIAEVIEVDNVLNLVIHGGDQLQHVGFVLDTGLAVGTLGVLQRRLGQVHR